MEENNKNKNGYFKPKNESRIRGEYKESIKNNFQF